MDASSGTRPPPPSASSYHGRIADLLWNLKRGYVEFLDDSAPEIVALTVLQVLEEIPGHDDAAHGRDQGAAS